MATASDGRRRTGRPRVAGPSDPGPPREAILAVAGRLFAERGFVDTTLKEIARRAGLRTSSLYYYFDGKDAMLHAIVNEVNRVSLDRLAAVNRHGGRPSVRLFSIIRFDVRSLCTLPYDVNEIQRLSTLQEDRFATYWSERQQLNDEVEELLREGIAAGDFRPTDTRLTALTILANDEGVQNWFRPLGEHRLAGRSDAHLGEYTPGEIGTHLARMALDHLLRDRRALPGIERGADALDADLDATAVAGDPPAPGYS